jgi:galactose-1-phosphate uridylyltransferase
LLPKRHVRALVDLSRPEKQQLAEAMQQVVRTYDSLFGFAFPYSTSVSSRLVLFFLFPPCCTYLRMC